MDETNAASLVATLHEVIDDHTRLPYTSSSTDTWDVLESAQQDPGDPTRVLDVYRNESFSREGGGNPFYDREHTWPRSFGFPDDGASNYPFTDTHMLHLADGSYNGSRSNRPFGTCSSGCSIRETVANAGQGGGSEPYPGDDNWTRSSGGVGGLLGRWETWSGRRGDVARALFYADVRYEGGLHGLTGVLEPDLILTDDETLIAASNTGSNEATAYMGMLSTLLQWHADDPVDDLERHRNDVVFAYQGNRNPFVDHPEWVEVLYADEGCLVDMDCDDGRYCNGTESCIGGVCSDGPAPCGGGLVCDEMDDQCVPSATAASVWINEFHYDNSGSDQGEFFEIAGSAGTSLDGWSLVAYNGANGSIYATVPLGGVLSEQEGCAGALAFPLAGMQNGSPDGLALADAQGRLVEFLSYEGSFGTSLGVAAGEVSEDIGVGESSGTPIGWSLQRVGNGAVGDDFEWSGPVSESPGLLNAGQQLSACPVVPVPAVGSVLGRLGLVALVLSMGLASLYRSTALTRPASMPGNTRS